LYQICPYFHFKLFRKNLETVRLLKLFIGERKETHFRANSPPAVKVSPCIALFVLLRDKYTQIMRIKGYLSGLLLAFFAMIAHQLPAQKVGVGFQVGSPTGLSLHFRNNTGAMRPDILFAWDFDDDDRDFFFVNVHGLWFKRLGGKEPFHFYYGPGAFIGIRDDDRKGRDYDDETVVGFSGNFGLNYEFSRLDIFIQITPRLSIAPNTDFEGGGGLGMRFFF
jgi:hypothetical protein